MQDQQIKCLINRVNCISTDQVLDRQIKRKIINNDADQQIKRYTNEMLERFYVEACASKNHITQNKSGNMPMNVEVTLRYLNNISSIDRITNCARSGSNKTCNV